MTTLISFNSKGDFSKTIKFLSKSVNSDIRKILDQYGRDGVKALSSNTPKDSGLTAQSWSYKIKTTKTRVTLSWFNSNSEAGVPIAIILQYGHATKNGGWVEGVDYVNPSLKPIFDKMANAAWMEVNK